MSSDFLDAHHRHWDDAELLFSKSRLANADHLFGISAECGLKALMKCFGMEMNTRGDRPQEREDAVHADRIWQRYSTYQSNHHQGTQYLISSVNPFDNWNAGQRYANQSQFNQQNVQDHRVGAEQVRNLIVKAVKDGLI